MVSPAIAVREQEGGQTDSPRAKELRQKCQLGLGLPYTEPIPGGTVVVPVFPGIVDQSVRTTGSGPAGRIYVNLTIQDVNSWKDVYAALVILYYRGEPQACAGFKQNSNASDFTDVANIWEDLMEPTGSFEGGVANRVRVGNPTVLETHYNISFRFKKVASNYVYIQVWDRTFNSLTSDFEIDPTLRPTIVKEPIFPWLGALFTGFIATVILARMRLSSNTWAQVAERKAKQARAIAVNAARNR